MGIRIIRLAENGENKMEVAKDNIAFYIAQTTLYDWEHIKIIYTQITEDKGVGDVTLYAIIEALLDNGYYYRVKSNNWHKKWNIK